ncbi:MULTISPECIES: glycosyltransferase family 4 protein [Marinobacter]|uniref:Glycosyl transferase n=1 Tax=Marinobacter profundi TaxID=2666256 RepID=A0A2G1UHQ9_9GAMM|nr:MULTISPECIES: glycosyltransferase family 4 protein [Marinobacter]MBD3657733.1 glycosyltransferase family 4 protein [Marinobacter sp.]PHQ13992.1 glycosyl transferase [Marinobacter profundi]
MRILQVLPALFSGGVERGTVEFAAELVKRGHDSFVLSRGGPMVEQLERQGSVHVALPVHRKSLTSLTQIRPVRRLIRQLRPDIIHVRSRMPAWIVWLALRGLPEAERPVVVSTFHGMYSVNRYSAIMARANQVIAVSECVRDYVLKNYQVPREQLTVIQRGVDVDHFRQRKPAPAWSRSLLQQYPELAGKTLIMMPGRISRWKGHLAFLEVMANITRSRPDCHGIIVGNVEPGKTHFLRELIRRRNKLGLQKHVTFLGQRNDIADLYRLSGVVCHLSNKPEPFGRTVTEALASGTPVAAFNRGGAAETLRACFPAGLVPPDDIEAFTATVLKLLAVPAHHIEIPPHFRLEAQTEATLAVYRKVLRQD